MKKRSYKAFDTFTVPLKDSNLIEASAGTGKTYSIAILVLRLVLEQQLPVKSILMVTFTKAAVAELEERIRLFVRAAYKASLGRPVADQNVSALVKKAIDGWGDGDGTRGVQQILRDAVLLLDETSVKTIHSFCQHTLLEFAFETNQLFGVELTPDMAPLLDNALNAFWRRCVTTLDTRILRQIWSEDMRNSIRKLLEEHLNGKHYLGFDPAEDYTISADLQKKWVTELSQMAEEEALLKEELYAYITMHRARLTAACEGNGYAKKSLLSLVASPEDFCEAILSKRSTNYVVKLFSDILDKSAPLTAIMEKRGTLLPGIRQRLNNLSIQEAGEAIRLYKERNNVLNYEDLIDNLHTALVKRDNPGLEAALRKKYRAVFIDEFQDTDRKQYEIFNKAFGHDTTLFYIGDPKQSIYGWRKADIFTYFQARSSVSNVYGMNHNFRSSERFIESMNRFFLPTEDFDTFFFRDEVDGIDYIPVESPKGDRQGDFYKGTQQEVPLSVRTLPKEDIASTAAAVVSNLLRDKSYQLKKGEAVRSLVPSDIGILVRSNREGKDIKSALSRLNIPAVRVDDSKVMASEEASYLLYLLEAIEEPSRSAINKALLSPFTGYSIQDILMLDDESVIVLFNRYRTRWHADGVYAALIDFMNDFGVHHVLLGMHTENGERVISNFMQLAELIHQTESRKSFSTIETISWIKRSIGGILTEGDEYIQRIESDEEAVKIVTIHKSKGLEYNIVLAPYLEFSSAPKKNASFLSFRDPSAGEYVGAEKRRLSKEQLDLLQQQTEQENRRLLYVALTRAVYKCYLFKAEDGGHSTLSVFTDVMVGAPGGHVLFEEGSMDGASEAYRTLRAEAPPARPRPVRWALLGENWRRMSYTQLAAKPAYEFRPRSVPGGNAYDTFVFNTLRRGAKTGDMLHFLLENIHFSDDSRWDKWIDEGIRRYAPGQSEVYQPMLRQLLSEVLNARVRIGEKEFNLSVISRHKRINEFEFDFPVPLFRPSDLNVLSADIVIKDFRDLGTGQLEGVMNGKMDLFFELDGQYYILDWKSNYLGAALTDYAPDRLTSAMRDNNYHLQYLIYTVAAKKYLENRLSDFDYDEQFGGVIYFFIRGARAGSDQSIFSVRPPREELDRLERMFGK